MFTSVALPFLIALVGLWVFRVVCFGPDESGSVRDAEDVGREFKAALKKVDDLVAERDMLLEQRDALAMEMHLLAEGSYRGGALEGRAFDPDRIAREIMVRRGQQMEAIEAEDRKSAKVYAFDRYMGRKIAVIDGRKEPGAFDIAIDGRKEPRE